MFTLPAPQQNPLDLIVANAGAAYVQDQIARNVQERESQAITRGLSDLSEDSSPLEWFRAINSLRDVSPETKGNLFKAQETIQRAKLPEARAVAKARADADKLELEQQRLWNVAKNMGVDPTLIPEGTPYNEGIALIKQFKQSTDDENLNAALREATGDPLADQKSPIELYHENVAKFGHAKAKDIADLFRRSRPKLEDPAEKRRQRDSIKSSYKSLEDHLHEGIKSATRSSDIAALKKRLEEVRIAKAKDEQLIEKGLQPHHYFDIFEKVLGERLVEPEEEELEEEVPPAAERPAIKKNASLDDILFGGL